MKITSNIEKAIRENFPGSNNSGLRKELRETIAAGGNVMGIAHRVGLTGHRGLPALEAVAEVVSSEAVA